eukprot:maker-scaffold_5-augustus-gene-16.14-mRNA-1 protein AED:0.13 eAED:0.18 QI:0/0/0/1/0/0.33/3/0/575
MITSIFLLFLYIVAVQCENYKDLKDLKLEFVFNRPRVVYLLTLEAESNNTRFDSVQFVKKSSLKNFRKHVAQNLKDATFVTASVDSIETLEFKGAPTFVEMTVAGKTIDDFLKNIDLFMAAKHQNVDYFIHGDILLSKRFLQDEEEATTITATDSDLIEYILIIWVSVFLLLTLFFIFCCVQWSVPLDPILTSTNTNLIKMSGKCLVPTCTIPGDSGEVFSVRFSPDSSLLAAGSSDGVIKIYQPQSGKLLCELKMPENILGSLPITGIRFRPPNSASKTKNILIAASADGSVSQWHVTSGQCLHRIWTDLEEPPLAGTRHSFTTKNNGLSPLQNLSRFKEYGDFEEKKADESSASNFAKFRQSYREPRSRRSKSLVVAKNPLESFVSSNQVFCIDYRFDGKLFASAGKDKIVRVYDEATKQLVNKMETGTERVTPGHSNRVFSLKFNPDDPNTLISGGWDNTVQIWDLRVSRAVRSIFGPHICGDSVDLFNGTILTGSWRPDNQLQLWDFISGELIEEIDWHQSPVRTGNSAMLYCAEFSKGNGRYIAAGGSGTNEAKVFDRHNGIFLFLLYFR